jgi:lactobin A/cerein 7B family class IIb bacteriocin
MDKFDLKSLGVQEMTDTEMRSVDGGCLFAVIVAGIIVLATIADAIWDIDGLHTAADNCR